MTEIRRIILDAAAGDLMAQLDAAEAALLAGIDEGGIFGFGRNGKFFMVKRNIASVRVYPQQDKL